jgi:transcriptional regulator with XRE-family HTH domain
MLVIGCRKYGGMDPQKAFGSNMRRIREARGHSQEKLGELADLHRTYIGSIERGEQNVSLRNIVAIAVALRVPVSDLVAGLPHDPGGTSSRSVSNGNELDK